MLALVCVLAPGAAAQPLQSTVVIDGDIRIFAVVTALNVAGFDVELGAEYHPARTEIRKIANNLDPDLLRRMREFYSSHKHGEADEDQLAKYISLAVVLTDPPFKPIGRPSTLPDDAREVLDFVPLLQEFYEKAAIIRLWSTVSPVFEAEMDRMGPLIRDVLAETDAYLRASSGLTAQTMRITVELSAPKNSVNVRSHLDDYFVVLGYAATPKLDEVRHAYLHLRLNNYATIASMKVPKRGSLLALLSGVEGVQREFASSFETMLTESLVRAVELRIERQPAEKAEERIRNYYRSGLLLVPYFYESLPTYEAGDNPFRDELNEMVEAIDVAKEISRFEKTFQSIPLQERQPLRAEVPAPQTVDPVLELLRAAEAVFDKDKPLAGEAFEKVLKEHDPNNGRALYGLALIEMDKANLDEALRYFDLTIKSDSAYPSMKTWSYIYGGHILDFKCDRPAALERYRKAIETGDNTRDAQKIAQRDLVQPFGGECRQ